MPLSCFGNLRSIFTSESSEPCCHQPAILRLIITFASSRACKSVMLIPGSSLSTGMVFNRSITGVSSVTPLRYGPFLSTRYVNVKLFLSRRADFQTMPFSTSIGSLLPICTKNSRRSFASKFLSSVVLPWADNGSGVLLHRIRSKRTVSELFIKRWLLIR